MKCVSACDEMKKAYLLYSFSTIIDRALPDVRDGLKPVHRRILYAMHGLGLTHNKPYKKCARIVGEALGKFHPHGDKSVYDALVRMAQNFSMRYPLIDGQGNFGSIDGDAPASMRYTECRLAPIVEHMIEHINTVQMKDNFDATLKEPVLLPVSFPHLLVNGSSGIAVGTFTSIPPHNLKEVCSAVIALIDNPDIKTKRLLKHIKGPDFPTGGKIKGNLLDIYEKGYGNVTISGKAEIENKKIRITEIPYTVNKSQLVEKIYNLAITKEIEGISTIRDESDRHGLSVVIELKKGASAEKVYKQICKKTPFSKTYSINMSAIKDKKLKTYSLKEMLMEFIEFRTDIIKKHYSQLLEKYEKRKHILSALINVLIPHLNAVIKIIKTSKTKEIAKSKLIKKYKLSETQAEAVLNIPLYKISSLEIKKLKSEYNEIVKQIKNIKKTLSSDKNVHEIIKTELKKIIKLFGDERRTLIQKENI